MFAVKGWSVDSTALKPQTEAFKSRNKDREKSKKSKKRKRDDGKEERQDSDVRSDDVDRPEKRHIAGDVLSKSERKKDRKAQKLERAAEETTTSNVLPNGEPKIEKWEDIILGTRKQKAGIQKTKKKDKHNEQPKIKETAPQDVETSDASDSEGGVASGAKSDQAVTTSETPAAAQVSKLTPMQSAMRQKLVAARFRHLNETLYTEPSAKAQELFDQNPEMFEDYHNGFRQQVSVWPENPLDKFIIAIRERGKIKPPYQFKPYRRKANSKLIRPPVDDGKALPRMGGTSVIADLGCGEGRLAHTLTTSGDTSVLHLRLHSFDLYSTSKHVTKADISNVPLKDDSVDVAILCLALMGTNWLSFVEEAHRILHWKGELWVAEIKSRFGRVSKTGKPVDHSVGAKRKQLPPTKAQEAKVKEQEEIHDEDVLQMEVDGVPSAKEETDVSAFVRVLKRRGFILKPPQEKSVNLRNKMFVKMEFIKALTPIKGKGKPETGSRAADSNQKLKFFDEGEDAIDSEEEAGTLKPCLYKLR